jgi:carbonic anhydrase
MKKLLATILLIALCACAAPAAEHPHWGYEGDGGPEHWGMLSEDYATCEAGTEQSPIDLSNAASQDLANIEFSYAPSSINILNNGHTVQVNYDEGSYIQVDGVRYDLLQFHFHVPSEHTLEGQSFPAELHLVHRDADGNLAVVGLLLAEGSESAALAPVWPHLPAQESEVHTADGTVNAADLLPAEQATYRYPGSLTTPPCNEGVSWFVMMEPVELSTEQLQQLTAIIHGSNRPVQDIGERELVGDTTP